MEWKIERKCIREGCNISTTRRDCLCTIHRKEEDEKIQQWTDRMDEINRKDREMYRDDFD